MANGYQIDDLEDAVQALEDVVPDLEIDLNVIDQVEGTVWFYVAYQGANPHEATHPAVTVASHLAEIIAKALGSQAVEEHKALIEAIRNAPLAKPEPTDDDSEDSKPAWLREFDTSLAGLSSTDHNPSKRHFSLVSPRDAAMLYSIDRRRGAGIDRPARISLRLGVAFAGTAAVAMMLFSAVDKIRNAADRSH